MHGSNREPLMSALGQKRTLTALNLMSALPPKADIADPMRNVRFVPEADISAAARHARSDIGPKGLRAGTRHEATNSFCAEPVDIGPHDGRAETVGLGYHGRVRHYNPFSLNSYTIVALLCFPVDILQTDTVGKSTAQSISARKAVEPFLERRIGETSVVTRV